jgi:hypothetical protein
MHHSRRENYVPQETGPEPRRRPRLSRAAWMTAGALAVGVGAAACGGGPSTPGVASGSTTAITASPSAGGKTQTIGLLAYASCMRTHGVPGFPDPDGSGGIPKDALIRAQQEVSNSQLNAALNDCRRLLPPGGSLSGQPSRTVTAQQQEYYLKAAACMRSHGFTKFPEPNFSGGNVSFPGAFSDTESPQFTQALRTCQRLIPSGLPYSGSG